MTQSLAGLKVKAWDWEAPQTQCSMAIQTFQVLGFFYRCQRPAKCAGSFAEQKVLEKNQIAQLGERGGWTHSDLLLKIKGNVKSKQQKLQQKEKK